MIFDIRTYRLQPHRRREWLEVYAEHGYPVQVEHLGEPLFVATTEVGCLNEVVHVWTYESHAEREVQRAAMERDPKWSAYLERTWEAGAAVNLENRLARSAWFSPR